MSFESFGRPRAVNRQEEIQTPEQREKEVQSKLFKGLIAVGAGALSTTWDWVTGGEKETLWEEIRGESYKTEAEFKENGFFGTAANRIKTVYETLDGAEKILDPKGDITLLDVFDEFLKEVIVTNKGNTKGDLGVHNVSA